MGLRKGVGVGVIDGVVVSGDDEGEEGDVAEMGVLASSRRIVCLAMKSSAEGWSELPKALSFRSEG